MRGIDRCCGFGLHNGAQRKKKPLQRPIVQFLVVSHVKKHVKKKEKENLPNSYSPFVVSA